MRITITTIIISKKITYSSTKAIIKKHKSKISSNT